MIKSVNLTNEWLDIKTPLGLKDGDSYLFSNNGNANILISEEISGNNILRLNSNQVNVSITVGTSLFARISSLGQSGALTVTESVSGGSSAGNTNLGFLETANGFQITSSTGNPAEVPNATSLTNGGMSKEDKSKLDSLTNGIALQGDWDASTNTPDITGTTQVGHAWIVSVAGNTDLGGITDWKVNDLAIKTATGWAKIDNTDTVVSVNGEVGAVQLDPSISIFRNFESISLISGLTGANNSTVLLPEVNVGNRWAGLISANSQNKLNGIEPAATKTLLQGGTNVTIDDDGAGTFTINATDTTASTNLGVITSGIDVEITSSTGGSATISAADSVNAGVLSASAFSRYEGYEGAISTNVNDIALLNTKVDDNNTRLSPKTDSRDPTASDNTYPVGKIWINVNTNGAFVCTNNSTSAVWEAIDSQSAATNLGNTSSPTEITITSSTGSDTNLSSATSSNAGILTASSFNKYEGYQQNIALNSADITALNFTVSNISRFDPAALPRDPLPTDDSSPIGRLWVNTSTDKAYICVGNTSGAAQWDVINSSGGGSSLATIVVARGPLGNFDLIPQDNHIYLRGTQEIIIDTSGVADGTRFSISSFNQGPLGQVYIKGNTNGFVFGQENGENRYVVGLDTAANADIATPAQLSSFEVSGKGIPLYLNALTAQYDFVTYQGNLIGG